jgi:hypothetical protein
VRSRWLWVGAVLLLATLVLGFAHIFGWAPASLQIASGSGGSEDVTGTSTSSVANSTASSNTASSSLASSLASNSTATRVAVGVVSSVSSLVRDLFVWLLGDSLESAIINMAALLVLLAVVYAVMRFVKYIALIVVVVGSLLILLRYVFCVV